MWKCSLSQWVYCSALCTQDLRLMVTWKAPEFQIIVVVPRRAQRVVLHSESIAWGYKLMKSGNL